MYVLIDTNILLADPWQKSAKTGALIDFLRKVRGRLLIHEVSWQEAEGTLTRRWWEAITAYNSAADAFLRLGLPEQPTLGPDELVSDMVTLWREAAQRPRQIKRTIPLDNGLLPEVLRRAVNRIPPCARRGEGFRDALIWLGALGFVADRPAKNFAFISANTRDFADRQGNLLPGLADDAKAAGITVDYYSSLDAFLKEQAEPLDWLTLEWVSEHVDPEVVDELLWEGVQRAETREYQLNWLTEEGWEPVDVPEVSEVRGSLVDMYIWEYADAEKVVFLMYAVDAKAHLRFNREVNHEEGPPYEHWVEREDSRFAVEAELLVEISATVTKETVINLEVDHVQRI